MSMVIMIREKFLSRIDAISYLYKIFEYDRKNIALNKLTRDIFVNKYSTTKIN